MCFQAKPSTCLIAVVKLWCHKSLNKQPPNTKKVRQAESIEKRNSHRLLNLQWTRFITASLEATIPRYRRSALLTMIDGFPLFLKSSHLYTENRIQSNHRRSKHTRAAGLPTCLQTEVDSNFHWKLPPPPDPVRKRTHLVTVLSTVERALEYERSPHHFGIFRILRRVGP